MKHLECSSSPFIHVSVEDILMTPVLEKSRLRRKSYQCVQIPDGGSKDDRATVKGLEAMATN